jgi:SAM-dependent methyltransferase
MKASANLHHLDRFAILNNCLIVDGWAIDARPQAFYAGKKLPSVYQKVVRPDLTAAFGLQAEDWGFTLCALLPTNKVDATKFSFQFNRFLTIDNPCSIFSAASNAGFLEMRSDFVDAVNAQKGRVLEIGSRARSGNSYRGWFSAAREYVGVDVTDGPGVDIVADAHELSRHVTGTFDFAFSLAVFEHLLMPWKVALELNKVLRTGGRAMIISHAGFPLHEEPWDFFRFSREAWQGLFNAHTGFRLVDAQYEYPARIIPDYAHDGGAAGMSHAQTFLLSGCVVERVGPASVEWARDASEIYDLGYSHA